MNRQPCRFGPFRVHFAMVIHCTCAGEEESVLLATDGLSVESRSVDGLRKGDVVRLPQARPVLTTGALYATSVKHCNNAVTSDGQHHRTS